VGLGVVRNCARGGGSGFARRSLPACGVPATETGQGPRHLVQKDQGNMLLLTEGSNWPVKQCRVVGGEGRAARTAALTEEDDAGASVLLVTMDRLGVVL
jgi:hypothetical protein